MTTVPIIAATTTSPTRAATAPSLTRAASASSPTQDHSSYSAFPPKMMRRKSVNDKQSLWMKKLQEQKDGQKGAGGADHRRAGLEDAALSTGAAAKRSPISSLWLETIKSSSDQKRESYSSAPLTISEIRAEGQEAGGGSMMMLPPDAPHSSSSQADPQQQQTSSASSSSSSSTTTEASTAVTNTAS